MHFPGNSKFSRNLVVGQNSSAVVEDFAYEKASDFAGASPVFRCKYKSPALFRNIQGAGLVSGPSPRRQRATFPCRIQAITAARNAA